MAKLGKVEKKVMLSDRHAEDGVEKARGLLQYVHLEGKRDYLELGCGGGHVTRLMATECGLDCVGTDVDPDMVEHAKARSREVEHVRFMVVDATDLPFEDGSFDLALSFGVIHHIGEWPKALSEVSRVLRPGGDYILGDIFYSRFSRAILKPFVKNYGVYTIDELIERAKAYGLSVGYRSPPMGSILKYHALVLGKAVD